MKVICIDDKGISTTGAKGFIKEGETYTATESEIEGCYKLIEIPFDEFGWPISYKKWRFIPISEIDETTFERNYKTETV